MKLLVNIGVPAIRKHYDVLIPDGLTVREITPMVADAVKELSGGVFFPSGEEFLCSKEQGLPLSDNHTLAELDLKDGDHLLLI